MSRPLAVGLFVILAAVPPAHAKPPIPPPRLTVSAVTSTSADIVIEPVNAVPCRVLFKVGSHYVDATGALAKQVAHVVGLAPDTEYEFRALCGQAHPKDGVIRTVRSLAPLPPLPQVLSTSKGVGPGMLTASFTPPAGVPTACWWQWSMKFSAFMEPITEYDCSQTNGVSPPTQFPHKALVRFGMRNAAGVALGNMIPIP